MRLIDTFAPVASYFTVNVSSPNTPGLRNLQQAAALDDLLARVIEARERVRRNAGETPVLLKIAPDLSLDELLEQLRSEAAKAEARRRGAGGSAAGGEAHGHNRRHRAAPGLHDIDAAVQMHRDLSQD